MKLHHLAILFTLLMPAAALAQATIDAVIYTKQGEVPLKLETATTEPQREKGLMNRPSLAPSDGMLFVFPEPRDTAFWMKNTPLSLDMLFIRADRSIDHIEANTVPYSLDPHRGNGPSAAVIELDGGRAAKEGIAEGDMVNYALPKNLPVH